MKKYLPPKAFPKAGNLEPDLEDGNAGVLGFDPSQFYNIRVGVIGRMA